MVILEKPPLPPGSGKPLPWPFGPHVAFYKQKTHRSILCSLHCCFQCLTGYVLTLPHNASIRLHSPFLQ